MKTMKPEEVNGWDGRLVDVRNLDEFAYEHLEQATCVPLGRLLSEAGQWDRSERLALTSKSGKRATEGARQLEEVGFTDVFVVEGGLNACKKAGAKIIFGQKRLPLQQQVMVVAGVILLIGLVLARWNPWFLLIDGFVAVGLIVGGLTGICPMASVLAKMPWNAVSSGSSCSTGLGCTK